MRQIRVSVIGTGFIGPAHIEALRRIAGVSVVAVASIEPDRARLLADMFGIPRVHDTWEDAVRDREVEVIHNCTPNNLHYQINRAALIAGKHVLSEKPLTISSKESGELVRLARQKGLLNAVNFNYRFYPLIQHARSMVQKGEMGEIYLVHGHYLQDWLFYDTDYNWRLEPDISGPSRAVADIGSHWCDLVQFVSGRRITRVCADLVTFHPKRKKPRTAVETFKGKEQRAAKAALSVPVSTEDAGIVMFQLDNGGRGVFTVSQVSAGRKNREWFEIDGSKKAIAWDQEEPNQLWIGHRERANELLAKDPSLLHEDIRRYAHYPGGHPEGYPDGPKNLFINFYTSLREGKDPRKEPADYPTFADGHWEICLVESILKSSRQRRWVNVTAVQ